MLIDTWRKKLRGIWPKAATSHDCGVASSSAAKLHGILFSLSASLLTIAKCLAPLLPKASQGLFQKLGETDRPCERALQGRRIEVGTPLFPKL